VSDIEVTVNGVPRALHGRTTVADVVSELAPSDRGVAVAIDRCVVPRSEWASTVLRAGCAIEIVGASAGG
jgi:sulfur carrier protein